MYLPDAPARPASSLSDLELLELFRIWGRCSKVATRRALALLPEIIRRGLYRKKFSSPFEFAFKMVGATGSVVRRVLRLHDQIGHMPELWNVLATGEEGWAKLEIVAGVARPDTAAWWAEQVRKCSAAELRELVRRLEIQKRGGAPTLRENVAVGRDAADRSAAEGVSASSESPGGFPGGSDTEGVRSGNMGADRAEGLQVQVAIASLPTPVTALPAADDAMPVLGGAVSEAAPAVSPGYGPWPAPKVRSSEIGAAASARAEDLVMPNSGGDVSPPGLEVSTMERFGAGRRPITIYLSAEDEALLRAWQENLRRAEGKNYSLGEVIGRLLRGELLAPELGACTSNCGRPAVPEPSGERGERGDGIGRGERGDGIGRGERGDASNMGERDSGSAAAPALPAPTTLTALAALAPRRVEVIIRPVGLPGAWTRRLLAVLPAGIAAAFGRDETLSLEDLFLDAVEAARRHKGDWIPFPVRKFVALRAGFRCEAGGCRSPIHEFDHILPRAEGGNHHPDNVRALCALHHKVRHYGLFEDLLAGTLVEPGSPDRSSMADKAFQAAVARATDASGP